MGRKENLSKEELERMYIHKKMSTINIGKEIGMTSTTIRRWLMNYSIARRNLSESRLQKGVIKPSKEELEKMYRTERMSPAKIGERIGVSPTGVYQWLRDYQISTWSYSEAQLPKDVKKPSKEKLEEMYVEKGMNTAEMAEQIGTVDTTIQRWLKMQGILARSRSEARLPSGVKKPSKEELERMYVRDKRSSKQIAEAIGVSQTAIISWLRNYSISRRSRSEIQLGEGVKKPSKEELERMYHTERRSTIQIGKKTGVGPDTILYWLREYKIPIRSISESKLAKGVIKPSKEELKRMYITERMSTVEIGDRIRTVSATISRWMKEYSLSARSSSEIGAKNAESLRHQKYNFQGNFYDSQSEAATGVLMEKYIPGYKVIEHKTFQMNTEIPKTIDFLVNGTFLEWHPILAFCGTKYLGDISSKEEAESYKKVRDSLECNERNEFVRDYKQVLAMNYFNSRQAAINKSPTYKGSELILAQTPEELYDSIITRFGTNYPSRDEFKREFNKVVREVKQSKKQESEAKQNAA